MNNTIAKKQAVLQEVNCALAKALSEVNSAMTALASASLALGDMQSLVHNTINPRPHTFTTDRTLPGGSVAV